MHYIVLSWVVACHAVQCTDVAQGLDAAKAAKALVTIPTRKVSIAEDSYVSSVQR